MQNDKPEPKNETSAAEIIQQIKVGALDPHILNKEQRQQCVEALYFEAISPSGIAQFLKVSDRTIRRDMEDIRVWHALNPDPDLARRIIGDYVLFAQIHRGNLMKLARNNSATVSERAQAEYYAYLVYADTISKLLSLGYLPKSADTLVVMQKYEEHESNGKITNLCAELDDMAQLSSSQEKAAKLLEIKKMLTEEKPNDNKQQ